MKTKTEDGIKETIVLATDCKGMVIFMQKQDNKQFSSLAYTSEASEQTVYRVSMDEKDRQRM